MNSLLSFKMWLIFIHRIFNALFPADLILLVFSLSSYKKLKESKALRFFSIFLVCDLGVRGVIFFAGVPFSGRYLFPFAVAIAILAAFGIIPLVEILQKVILKVKCNIKINTFYLYAILIIIIGISYSIKALLPRNDKPWLQRIPAAIKKLVPEGKTPVIISNKLDERFGYYADTTQIYMLDPAKNWVLMEKVKTDTDSKFIACSRKRGIANLAEKINELGAERVFIIMRVGKDGNSVPNTELLKKLPGIHLSGTFTDRKKRILKLYSIKQ